MAEVSRPEVGKALPTAQDEAERSSGVPDWQAILKLQRWDQDLEEVRNQPDDSAFSHIKHPLQRAFLEALAILGHQRKACNAAGITWWSPYRRSWKEDPEFQEAFEQAKLMGAESLTYEARRRAVEGVRKYKFSKTGVALLHPDECDCEHSRRVHGPDGGECTHEGCACQSFQGRPYFEHEYSDNLLMFLTKGILPEYKDSFTVRGTFANVDLNKLMDQLPDHAIAQLAAGESPVVVFAMLAKQMQRLALPPAKESDGNDG